MESTHLRVFATVARLGNITRAAEALHTVQSNVTMHIRTLEEELGARLLYRHRRGVTLTRAGEQLLPYAVKSEGLLSEARQTIRGKDRCPKGPLRIGTLETTAAIRLPQIVAHYGKRYPEVDLSLVTGTTGSLSQDVLAYRLEGAFVAGPTLNPDFLEEKIFVEELTVVSSPLIKDLRQLAEAKDDVKILVFREGCSYRNRLESILRTKGVQAVRVMEFGTLDGILGCAGAGLGITLLPRALVRAYEARRKVALHRLPKEQSRVETVFVRRSDGFLSPALASFLEFARRFKNKPAVIA